MKRLFPFLQLHGAFPVDSLRVRWVPLFPSFQRLGAFAVSPHPAVRGFPTLGLLCPIRLFLWPRGFVGGSLTYSPLPFASNRKSPVFLMTPVRSMLLTVQSGLHSLAPRAQSVPAYAQVLRHSSMTLSRRTRI